MNEIEVQGRNRFIQSIQSGVISGVCLIVLLLMQYQSVSQQDEHGTIVKRATKLRSALVQQNLRWLHKIAEQPDKKAISLLKKEVEEPEVFIRQVDGLSYLHSMQAGPFVLDYLLALDDPASVVQDEDVVQDLRGLGYPFTSSVAWEIKKRKNSNKEVSWLIKLLQKLEGERAKTIRKHIKEKPSRNQIQEDRGIDIQYAQIPRFFENDEQKRLVLDLDKQKLVKWPGSEMEKPDTRSLDEKELKKIIKRIHKVAREENLLVFSLRLGVLIFPTPKWKSFNRGLLQGRYDISNLKEHQHFIGGPHFRTGMRIAFETSDDKTIIFQPYQVPDKYGVVMAYAVVDGEQKNVEVAPPQDPKTMFSQLHNKRGKTLAYMKMQVEQKRMYADAREKALNHVRENLPEDVPEKIDQENARRIRVLGNLRVVQEAGRLIEWLSAEHDGTDTHPARAALAKIGTLGTARERALLDKPVTEQLLGAHTLADDEPLKKRIKHTLADIYGSKMAKQLLKEKQDETEKKK